MTRLLPAVVVFFASIALAAPPKGWKEYYSKKGAFSVIAPPTQPIEETQKVKVETGDVDMHSTMLQFGARGSELLLTVAWAEVLKEPAEGTQIDRILNGARDGMVKNLGGKLTAERKITIGTSPAREIDILLTMPPGAPKDAVYVARARLTLSGKRLVEALAMGSKVQTLGFEGMTFLGSLKIY